MAIHNPYVDLYGDGMPIELTSEQGLDPDIACEMYGIDPEIWATEDNEGATVDTLAQHLFDDHCGLIIRTTLTDTGRMEYHSTEIVVSYGGPTVALDTETSLITVTHNELTRSCRLHSALSQALDDVGESYVDRNVAGSQSVPVNARVTRNAGSLIDLRALQSAKYHHFS